MDLLWKTRLRLSILAYSISRQELGIGFVIRSALNWVETKLRVIVL